MRQLFANLKFKSFVGDGKSKEYKTTDFMNVIMFTMDEKKHRYVNIYVRDEDRSDSTQIKVARKQGIPIAGSKKHLVAYLYKSIDETYSTDRFCTKEELIYLLQQVPERELYVACLHEIHPAMAIRGVVQTLPAGSK